MEEIEAVRMSCWTLWVGGWVGGSSYLGGVDEHGLEQGTVRDKGLVLVETCRSVGGWVGGMDEEGRRRREKHNPPTHSRRREEGE